MIPPSQSWFICCSLTVCWAFCLIVIFLTSILVYNVPDTLTVVFFSVLSECVMIKIAFHNFESVCKKCYLLRCDAGRRHWLHSWGRLIGWLSILGCDFFFQLKACANIWFTRLQRHWLDGVWRILTQFRQQTHNLINVVCCCEMEFWWSWFYEMQFDLVSTCHQRFSGILSLFYYFYQHSCALTFLYAVYVPIGSFPLSSHYLIFTGVLYLLNYLTVITDHIFSR